MIKHITCNTPNRFVRVAWLSLQPNGDVSFGLSDKTYISPRVKGRQFVWSVFNRVTAEFEIESNPLALEAVKNPHFTFHRPHWFHLKSEKDRSRKDEALFEGLCDVPIVLSQQHEMPWIRATTAPISRLRSSGVRWWKVPQDDIPLTIPIEDLSVQIEVDFIRPAAIGNVQGLAQWAFATAKDDIAVRITASMTMPRIASLAWFHSY